MRPIKAVRTVGLVVALLAMSCAHERPAATPGLRGNDSLPAFSDSLEIEAYNDLYIHRHARVIEELEKRDEEGRMDARTVEARSIVAASEELYLIGKFRVAVRLLEEAELLLGQDHPKR